MFFCASVARQGSASLHTPSVSAVFPPQSDPSDAIEGCLNQDCGLDLIHVHSVWISSTTAALTAN